MKYIYGFGILVFCASIAGLVYFFSVRRENITVHNSVIVSVPSTPVPTVQREVVSLIVFGDLMLDRTVASLTKAAGDYAYPFEGLDPLFERYDIRVANHEGTMTDYPSVAAAERL